MHTTVDYSKLSEPEKSKKAIADLREFLGQEKYDHITSEFRQKDKMDVELFINIVSIGGISGFPVYA